MSCDQDEDYLSDTDPDSYYPRENWTSMSVDLESVSYCYIDSKYGRTGLTKKDMTHENVEKLTDDCLKNDEDLRESLKMWIEWQLKKQYKEQQQQQQKQQLATTSGSTSEKKSKKKTEGTRKKAGKGEKQRNKVTLVRTRKTSSKRARK